MHTCFGDIIVVLLMFPGEEISRNGRRHPKLDAFLNSIYLFLILCTYILYDMREKLSVPAFCWESGYWECGDVPSKMNKPSAFLERFPFSLVWYF